MWRWDGANVPLAHIAASVRKRGAGGGVLTTPLSAWAYARIVAGRSSPCAAPSTHRYTYKECIPQDPTRHVVCVGVCPHHGQQEHRLARTLHTHAHTHTTSASPDPTHHVVCVSVCPHHGWQELRLRSARAQDGAHQRALRRGHVAWGQQAGAARLQGEGARWCVYVNVWMGGFFGGCGKSYLSAGASVTAGSGKGGRAACCKGQAHRGSQCMVRGAWAWHARQAGSVLQGIRPAQRTVTFARPRPPGLQHRMQVQPKPQTPCSSPFNSPCGAATTCSPCCTAAGSACSAAG